MLNRVLSPSRGACLALVLAPLAAASGEAQQNRPVLELHPGAEAQGPAAPAPAVPPGAREMAPGLAEGYLASAALPDSLALLLPPPTQGSRGFAADGEASGASRTREGSKRWRLAGMDANLSFPWAAGDFSCALNASINPLDAPHLYQMLRRTLTDATQSARVAKDHYRRPAPFLSNHAPTCTPGAEARLAEEGSYPSDHAVVGAIWALILSELAPDQSEAILARGRAFGESRVVCNTQWRSDVAASLPLAEAVIARLHADPAFLADSDAAKAEIAAIRARKLPPQRDCKLEAAALAPP